MLRLMVCCVIVLSACFYKSNVPVSEKHLRQTENYHDTIDTLANRLWGKNYAIKNSRDKDYSIVFHKSKLFNQLFSDIDFFVFDHHNQKIIYEDHLDQGSVNWYAKDVIVAVSNKKIAGKMTKSIYFYNLRTSQMEKHKD